MKKKLITAAVLTFAAITLVVATVFTTLAILADSSAVSNTFTVGSVTIKMFETKVNEDGEPIVPKEEVDGNSYHLIPNKSYTKDPTIRITTTNASDEMFLFVKSTNQIREIEAGNLPSATAETPKSMRKQMEANGWVEFIQSGNGMDIVWVYGKRDPITGVISPTAVNCNFEQVGLNGQPVANVNAGEFRLCEGFTVGDVDGATVNLYGAAVVKFNAFAIQTTKVDTDNDNTVAKNSWESIKNTFPYEGGINEPKNPYDASADPYAPVAPVTP